MDGSSARISLIQHCRCRRRRTAALTGCDPVVSDPVEKQCDAWFRRDDGFILH
jgi:hypothetical protein